MVQQEHELVAVVGLRAARFPSVDELRHHVVNTRGDDVLNATGESGLKPILLQAGVSFASVSSAKGGASVQRKMAYAVVPVDAESERVSGKRSAQSGASIFHSSIAAEIRAVGYFEASASPTHHTGCAHGVLQPPPRPQSTAQSAPHDQHLSSTSLNFRR